ncbi:nitrous oxide reductase family maturation protein NosD [Salegentibacter chungangensis]|uniref:Nitrous oxide reductase family maturation protein NosD n=1 Tax=Salegentibacter chungangensis TaxID=1335724 RepID=A0ABW3NVJ2_9FLAO
MRNLIFFLFSLYAFTVSASEIEVCKSCRITSIQDAVNIAENGDTIRIRKGIYKEYDITIINKSLHLTGEAGAVVDAGNKGTAFSIRAENFSIQNLKIINVGRSYLEEFAGILIAGSKDFRIENIEMENVFFGLLIEKSSNGVILENTIQGEANEEANSGNGVHLWHCNNIRIDNNRVKGMRDGIYLEFVNECSISGNLCKDNLRYGLHFMFSNHDRYINNTFENNGAGVAVMFSKFIEMTGNHFKKNWGAASYGLLLKEITDAELKHNVFEDNTIAINADGTTRMDYVQNEFFNNGYAIKVHGACYQNVFSENNFLYNSFDLAYAGHINENKFDNNYWSDYSGYDLDKDGIGDVPYRPVKLFSYLVNKTPEAIILLRSMFIDILNFSEKVSPIFTPAELVDENPRMKKVQW